MARGRKPTPNTLKILRGSRRANPAEPDPGDMTDAAPPENLNAHGLREWERMIAACGAIGMLKTTDRANLESYCQSYGEWFRASLEAIDKPFTIVTEKGEILNPIHKAVNTAAARLAKLGSEFGFTPSSRSKVKVPPKKEKDAFEALMAKKRA